MSLNGLRPTRIEADRVISTFSFDLASSRTHRIPIEGESVGRRVKEQQNAIEGFVDPITSDGIGFRSNMPISELTEHVTRATEASNINATPLVAETTDWATVIKRADP